MIPQTHFVCCLEMEGLWDFVMMVFRNLGCKGGRVSLLINMLLMSLVWSCSGTQQSGMSIPDSIGWRGELFPCSRSTERQAQKVMPSDTSAVPWSSVAFVLLHWCLSVATGRGAVKDCSLTVAREANSQTLLGLHQLSGQWWVNDAIILVDTFLIDTLNPWPEVL